MAEATILYNVSLQELKDIIDTSVKENLDGVFDALKREKNETLLTREETFRFLKIDSTTLWYWTKAEKLKCYAIGNRRYYKKSEVLECLTLLKS
ncbi:helix-turn-helix domain-containing protein [Flavobacterium sp. AS60]|uniref:helix-turn-helix domain-containing protein n=1 Tax=Flavobacterium anseongense TaxID=2910677 RepID=UPI001F1BC087|nr:helix-turn-helix domain-containing protein [Flavobacterium sp. AS60]MCF6129319.1 helix-turn-helix domain-containing protein [Flavobacterium sp. AS60]